MDVFSPALCRGGRSSEWRRLHQSHLPGATCLRAERYKLMVITLLRPSLVLRLRHKGLCENNDSVADLKGGKSEPSACILKALTSVVKVLRAVGGRGPHAAETKPAQSNIWLCVFSPPSASSAPRNAAHVGLRCERRPVRNGTWVTSTFEHEAGFCLRPQRSIFTQPVVPCLHCPRLLATRPYSHVCPFIHRAIFTYEGYTSKLKLADSGGKGAERIACERCI